MKWKDWLEKWGMSSLKINAGVLEMNWEPKDPDRKAAWELYIELLTRVTTQHLAPEDGDEKTALDSVFGLFPLTRQTLKTHPGCDEFAKIAIVVLNQVLRPFTAKWHKYSLSNAFTDEDFRQAFRSDLYTIQQTLRKFTKALADMAHVEDLTSLEAEDV